MNYLKATLFFLFSLCALLCVGYAHSQTKPDTQPGEFYETNNIVMSNCSLMIEFDGASAKFKAPGHSKLVFNGFWPKTPGDVFMSSYRVPPSERPLLDVGNGPERPAPDETLIVRFAFVNGGVHPVSFIYDDIRLKQKSYGMISEKRCEGLKKVR